MPQAQTTQPEYVGRLLSFCQLRTWRQESYHFLNLRTNVQLIQVHESNIIYNVNIIIHVTVLQFFCQPPMNAKTVKQTRKTPCCLIFRHCKQESVIKTSQTHDQAGLEGWINDELLPHIRNVSPPLIKVWVKHLTHHSTSTTSVLTFFFFSLSTFFRHFTARVALVRNSVFSINRDTDSNWTFIKSNSNKASQSSSSGKQSRVTILRSRQCRKSNICIVCSEGLTQKEPLVSSNIWWPPKSFPIILHDRLEQLQTRLEQIVSSHLGVESLSLTTFQHKMLTKKNKSSSFKQRH